jgi:hypothetical protein
VKTRTSSPFPELLTFTIRIRESPNSIPSLPNSWETWRSSLGEVSYWDKTTPSIYTRGSWPIEFPYIQLIKQINLLPLLQPFYLLLQPPCCSSLYMITENGALSLPANLGQLDDVLALMGSLPSEGFDGFFASLPKN